LHSSKKKLVEGVGFGALEKLGVRLSCEKRKTITWTGEKEAPEGVNVIPLCKFLLEDMESN